MTSTPKRSISPVGKSTALVLGSVVFACLLLIGCAGYLKYELDRAEAVLAAPASSGLNADQGAFAKLQSSLGYSGYVGAAQGFAATHDAALLTNMKAQIKTADDIVAHMPEKIPTELRQDLQAITTMFDAVEQKAEKSTTDTTVSFTAADVAPLYATLPILDARAESAAAVGRLEAQGQVQFWAMLLTLVTWGSLIIAAAMTVGIYLALRDKNSAPMRALEQSVKNMARGDMRTSIWGMERSDMVGELARAIDLARYHFSQLPDMSLISDQGPVRLRFEGNTRSLFEAMMQGITRDSEKVRDQATSLTDAVTRQNEAMSLIASRVEAILHNVEKRGMDGDQQIRQALNNLVGTAQSLKHAQEHAADQLNRIVPFMQDRAKGLADITSIAGKQVAQTLQSLSLTEHGLKESVVQSQDAIKKFATTTDDLSGRLFGAVNLLQASGKVLAETTETTQSRLNEAIEKLNQERILAQAPVVEQAEQPEIDISLAPRLEAAIHSLEDTQRKLEERLSAQTEATQAQIDLLTTQSSGLLTQTTTTAQTLSSAADHLRDERTKFDEVIEQIIGKLNGLGSTLQQQVAQSLEQTQPTETDNTEQLSQLATQIQNMSENLTVLSIAVTTPKTDSTDHVVATLKSDIESNGRTLQQLRDELAMLLRAQNDITPDPAVADLRANIRLEFDRTTRTLESLRSDVAALATSVAQTPVLPEMPDVSGQIRDYWFQMAAQIEATRKDLVAIITQQIDRLETHVAKLDNQARDIEPARNTEQQIEQQTQILTELVATLGILDTHMQQLKSEVRVGRR